MTSKVVKRKTVTKKSTKPQNKFFKFISKIRWFFTELLKVYSSEKSYFSKKRIESGIGFIIAEWGMIFFLLKRIDAMDAYEFAVWASMQFIVAGYMVRQIQKEKEFESNEEEYSEYDESYEEPQDYDLEPDSDYDSEECHCQCHKEDEYYDDNNDSDECIEDKPKRTRKYRK